MSCISSSGLPPEWFAPDCRSCPRLAAHLESVRAEYPTYHAAPVAPFGDPDADLLVVGLAPGMHGANATGRPFTGDFAGILLYDTLHRFGFCDRAESRDLEDGLKLSGCRITNAVKCLPPQNKPMGEEVRNCNRFLAAEVAAIGAGGILLALGLVAHNAVLRALGLRQSAYRFAHGAEHALPGGQRLLDSYHCSRYNTQTRRLTPEMFRAVFSRARELSSRPAYGAIVP
jgi:uracil-DNA glycosylase family 4